jgi:hypothetical protein
MLVAAGGLYWGVALPARRATAQAEAELQRVEAERDPLRQRLEERERRRAVEEAWRRAGPGGKYRALTLRRSLLASIDAAPLSGLRLDVTPVPAPLAVRARLSAGGRFEDLVALAQRVVGFRTGLVPERLRWAVTGSEVSLDIEASTLRGQP